MLKEATYLLFYRLVFLNKIFLVVLQFYFHALLYGNPRISSI